MSEEASIVLIYDGECPVCSAYCKAIALRQLDPRFQILNAREPHKIVAEIHKAGINLDEGFVLKIEDKYYHGSEAINRLALMSTGAGVINKINYHIFRSNALSKILYPILRFARNALLVLLGRKKIGAGGAGA